MDWGGARRTSWRADASHANLSAMFAATSALAAVQQGVADRRLAAEIDNIGHEWRAVLAVGRVAALAWLAEALVGLAGAFYDAETQARPDRPTSINPYTHDLVASLLAPVEDLLAEATAALADPNRRPLLTRPLRIGPGGDIAGGGLPDPIPSLYARSLATGARRAHTASAVALSATQAAVAKSPAPEWLTVGLQRLDGELRAAGARMEMVETRLAPLGEPHGGHPAELAPLCRDIWMIVDAALVVGQVSSDPHLAPEAQPEARRDSWASASPPASPSLPPPPRPQVAAPLPAIEEGPPSLGAQRDESTPAADEPHVPPRLDPALPTIGAGPEDGARMDVPPLASSRPAVAPPVSVTLPVVGDQSQPGGSIPPADAAPAARSPRGPLQTSAAKTGESDDEADDEPLVRFPAIG